jgi:hypothetical protein
MRCERDPSRISAGQHSRVKSHVDYGVADARADARQALAAVGRGEEPADDKREDWNAMTFIARVDDYVKVAKTRKKTWAEDQRILKNVADKHGWKHWAVRDIRRRTCWT